MQTENIHNSNWIPETVIVWDKEYYDRIISENKSLREELMLEYLSRAYLIPANSIDDFIWNNKIEYSWAEYEKDFENAKKYFHIVKANMWKHLELQIKNNLWVKDDEVLYKEISKIVNENNIAFINILNKYPKNEELLHMNFVLDSTDVYEKFSSWMNLAKVWGTYKSEISEAFSNVIINIWNNWIVEDKREIEFYQKSKQVLLKILKQEVWNKNLPSIWIENFKKAIVYLDKLN